MQHNKKKTLISGAGLLTLSTSLLLTACGGGGGGSDGGPQSGPSAKMFIEYPSEGAAITLENNAAFRLSNDANTCDGLWVELNGSNVSSLFQQYCENGDVGVPFFKVKGFLNQGGNELRASVAFSDTPLRKFTANTADGQAFITTVSNITNSGLLPVSGDYVQASGFTRKSGLSSIKLNNVSGTVQGLEFSVDPTLPAMTGQANDQQADFSLVASYGGKNYDTTYAVNGRQFDTLAGLQLNNKAFDAVSPWLGQVLGAFISENLQEIEVAPSADSCQALPANMRVANAVCGLSLLGIGEEVMPGEPLIPNVELRIEVDETPNFIDAESGFELRVVALLGGYKIDLEIPVQQADSPDTLGSVSSRLTFANNDELRIRLLVEKLEDGAIGLRFADGADGIEFALSAFPEASGGTCTEVVDTTFCDDYSQSAVDNSIRARLSQAEAREQIVGPVSDILDGVTCVTEGTVSTPLLGAPLCEAGYEKTTLRTVVEETFMFETAQVATILQGGAGKDCQLDSEMVCMTQNLLPGQASTVVDTTPDAQDVFNHGGFISLGGGAKVTSTTGVAADSIKPALGSLMNTDALAFALASRLTNDSAIALALSENMLNQGMMVSYQAGAFSAKNQQITFENVEVEVPVVLLGITTYFDVIFDLTVLMDVNFNSVPQLNLDNARNGIWLKTPQITLDVSYQSIEFATGTDQAVIDFGQGLFVEGEPLANAVIDLEALLSLSVNNEGQPTLNVNSDFMSFSVVKVAVEDKVKNDLGVSAQAIENELNKTIPSLITSQVDDIDEAVLPSLGALEFDIENLLTDDSDFMQAENSNNKMLREQLPQTFVLTLPKDGIDVDNDETAIHFNGNLALGNESSSLFSIKFCSSSQRDSVSQSGKCKE